MSLSSWFKDGVEQEGRASLLSNEARRERDVEQDEESVTTIMSGRSGNVHRRPRLVCQTTLQTSVYCILLDWRSPDTPR